MVELSIINNASIYSFRPATFGRYTHWLCVCLCMLYISVWPGFFWKREGRRVNETSSSSKFICAEYQLIGFGCIFSFDMLMELGEKKFIGHGYIIDRSRAIRFINVLFTCTHTHTLARQLGIRVNGTPESSSAHIIWNEPDSNEIEIQWCDVHTYIEWIHTKYTHTHIHLLAKKNGIWYWWKGERRYN